jgi:hypothetical protein
MRFVYPEFLWALSLLIVPIIIHLFSFRRYKILYFSSLQFVQHVEQQNKSTQKLKNLLILICRLLVVAFIVLAFAQPYFPSSGKTDTAGTPVLSIHVDNSFSMTMKGVEGELLSEAVEAGRKLIEAAPLNTRIMLSTNAMDGVEARICTKVEALERLDRVQPSPMVRSYDEVVKWQKNNLKHHTQSEKFSQIQFVYLSDFQKNTNKFTELEADSSGRYIPVRLISQNQSNLSIDSVWFGSPFHKVGVNNELFVKVSNHGQVDLQNVQLQFQSGGMKRDLFVDIAKQSSSIVTLTFTAKKTGVQTGSVSITDKHFFADDDFFFTYTVAEKSSVLILNGPDANKNVASIYRLDNFYAVNEIDQGSFIQSTLHGVNLVVLNGVNEIPSGLNSNLVEYSKNGGTIAVFPGKNIDKNSINSFLSQLKMPLITKETTQSTRINKINYKDPFFKGVFEKEKENLSLPGVTKFYLTNESSVSGALSIIQFQNGKSLLYRNNLEQQSFLFTSVLSPDYGSFVSDILFTTVLLRIGELSLMNPPLSVTIGETANYPVYNNKESGLPIFIKGEKTEFIPEKRISGNVTYIDLSGQSAILNLQSGIFELENNGTSIGKIAVNYNRKESFIETWSESEIKTALEQAGILHSSILNVDKGVSSVNLNIEKPYPYWKIFVSFALLFFLTELLILKLWKNKTGN